MVSGMKKVWLSFIVFTSAAFAAPEKKFDSITISAPRATITQGQGKDKSISIAYHDNVLVKLGDQGEITSNKLEVIVEKKTTGSGSQVAADAPGGLPFDFKKVLFTGGIKLEHENRSACADRAELYPLEQRCKLIGNVRLEQKKESALDIPIISTCDEALVDLVTKEILFQSNLPTLVSTTITLSGYSRLTKKKKTKADKLRERKQSLLALKQEKQKTTRA
jgi:hypothetical protein